MAALCVLCCLFTVNKTLKSNHLNLNNFYKHRFLHLLSILQDFDILRDPFAF